LARRAGGARLWGRLLGDALRDLERDPAGQEQAVLFPFLGHPQRLGLSVRVRIGPYRSRSRRTRCAASGTARGQRPANPPRGGPCRRASRRPPDGTAFRLGTWGAPARSRGVAPCADRWREREERPAAPRRRALRPCLRPAPRPQPPLTPPPRATSPRWKARRRPRRA
jgi:hypothetical protein